MKMSNKVVTTVAKKLVPATLALSLAGTNLVADTEFGEEVPREVVEQLVGGPYGGEPKVYSDIFSGFPAFDLPPGFDIVASTDQGVQQTVILRTALAGADAHAAIIAAFIAAGWTDMPVFSRDAAVGFVSTDTRQTQLASLCNDTLGRMGISFREGRGARYVHLTRATMAALGGVNRNCAEEAELMTRGPDAPFRGSPQNGVRRFMPVLEMPPSDVATVPQGAILANGGGGGSSNDYETTSTLPITWSGEQLMAHFAEQIAEQGWELDTQVSGAQTAFGSWTKTVDGNALLGALTLLETREDIWDLRFRIVRRGGSPTAAVRDFLR